jgi:hypothetical protein
MNKALLVFDATTIFLDGRLGVEDKGNRHR